ncbi:MAG: hypothetical protein FJZ60_04170 [Chlamydiae bacterium]|nr:hypothetical protein [Chlamydiota bacterium]
MPSFTNISPLPVYNTPEILQLYQGKPLKNERGLLIGVEMVLLPGSKIDIISKLERGFYQIATPHYQVDYPLYVDGRHLVKKRPRAFFLPSYDEAILNLSKVKEGTRYIYGANIDKGIPSLTNDFPPPLDLDEKEKQDWILQGLDCSGLFFQICEGATLRNCSMLDRVGPEIKNRAISELRPLDLILTKGHVAIVESSKNIIESAKRFDGVRRTELTEELLSSEIFKGHRIIRPFFKDVPIACEFFS